jgi:acetyltransferase-like isoleucine patch superfamily enzyme
MAFSLNRFLRVQRLLVKLRITFYNRVWGTKIDPSAVISLKAKIDRTYPQGIVIGAYTYITFGASILAHDMVRNLRATTRIGTHCFIGANALILPGAVVTKDVPSYSIVAGNPAKVIKTGIKTREFGILVDHES